MPAGWKGPTPAMKLAEAAREEWVRLRDQRERFILAAMQGLLAEGRESYVDVPAQAVYVADQTIKRMNAGN